MEIEISEGGGHAEESTGHAEKAAPVAELQLGKYYVSKSNKSVYLAESIAHRDGERFVSYRQDIKDISYGKIERLFLQDFFLLNGAGDQPMSRFDITWEDKDDMEVRCKNCKNLFYVNFLTEEGASHCFCIDGSRVEGLSHSESYYGVAYRLTVFCDKCGAVECQSCWEFMNGGAS